MKSINEIKKIKEALIADNELKLKGKVPVGHGTEWHGPYQEPARTYLDDIYVGSDGLSGNMYGDSWNLISRAIENQAECIASAIPTNVYLTTSV